MKVESYSGYHVDGSVVTPADKRSSNMNTPEGKALIQDAIKIVISKRGFDKAKKLEPYMDTYELEYTLLKGTPHAGDERMLNGDAGFDTLAENYQVELQRIRESYSGEELEWEMAKLDKAYDHAAEGVANTYLFHMRMLSGDYVSMPVLSSAKEAQRWAVEHQAGRAEGADESPVFDEKAIEAMLHGGGQAAGSSRCLTLISYSQNEQDRMPPSAREAPRRHTAKRPSGKKAGSERRQEALTG